MQQRFWIIKFAPFRTSWSEIVRRGTFSLRGVRNPQARNNLAAMASGDPVLFYHSQQERAVVGVLSVTRTAYHDPTAAESRWLTCDFMPVYSLTTPVSLAQIRAEPALASFPLICQPLVAVHTLTPFLFAATLCLASMPLPGLTPEQQASISALIDHVFLAKRTDPDADVAELEGKANMLIASAITTRH